MRWVFLLIRCLMPDFETNQEETGNEEYSKEPLTAIPRIKKRPIRKKKSAYALRPNIKYHSYPL